MSNSPNWNDPEIQERLKNADPKLLAEMAERLGRALKCRRIEMVGYAAAGISLVLGLLLAAYLIAKAPDRTWVATLPFVMTGFCLWVFGRWSARVRNAPLTGAPHADHSPGVAND